MQRAKSARKKRRNGDGGEMAKVMDQIPFIATMATKGHTMAH
jgi:hypothetical protein